MPAARGRINRFTVMAMLQAARAETLGLPRPSAYSWGLNRAIFYAAAKRGFRGGAPGGTGGTEGPGRGTADRPRFALGDDEAIRAGDAEPVQFIIGDEPQTAAEFTSKIASRFGPESDFAAAWAEALQIVRGFDRTVLESRSQFYGEVYRPRRDALVEAWSARYGAPAKAR